MNGKTALLGAALSVLGGTAAAQPLVSLFDASAEDWSVETRSNPAGSFSFVGAFTAGFVEDGGDAGGHLTALDPDGFWSFFLAPDTWNGDRSAFSGRVLRYSTRTDADSFPDGRLVILFGNDGGRLSHDAGVPDLDVWTRRVIPLSEGSWFVGTFANGAVATQAQIDAVLADLEALYIGLEFGGDTAEERVDLDRVAFGVCAWDTAEPFGVLDLADINVFVAAFLANTEEADLVPDGIYDLADINAFVAGFTGGCP